MEKLEREMRDLWTRLDPEQRERVLAYMRSLDDVPAKHGSNLLHLAGSIPADDIKRMSGIIDKEFGQVDPDRW